MPDGERNVLFNTVLFTGNANPALAQEIGQSLGVELGKATVGRFSDGEVTVESSRTCAPATCSWCSPPARPPTRT
jgi:phosphoribosylpyrophosphate synthetase